ncbi:MAG: Gfo/Idh/MocA family oxidoreductase [Bacteroidetes bacterium]|nr:Gfo/Idh/MocA family oxidoreductase [Bacteroidota bacterium]
MSQTRRKFIRNAALSAAGAWAGVNSLPAQSYRRIIGANDRVRLGVAGFSDRFRNAHLPSYLQYGRQLNFEITAVSDLWNLRREEGVGYLRQQLGHPVSGFRNNEEMYAAGIVDAVFVSTPDFQHALHTKEAVEAGLDVYCEKPFAETMEDARLALQAVRGSRSIVQIGSQRRSGRNYIAAAEFIHSGKFGPINMVELNWNVNQPGRWRRPGLVAKCFERDLDWQRFLLNRPYEPFDARKYLEYRLFWPYSSGQPGQWMSHQIDTVHWYSGLTHPRSVTANGGVYNWRDGRTNWDTTTAVFDYGPEDDPASGFQVVFSSRMGNGDEVTTEIYYSQGGELNLNTNKVTPTGGLTEQFAREMNMQPNLLPEMDLVDKMAKVDVRANAGGDEYTASHIRNWMECIRSRQQPNAPVEAGFYHSVANIMVNAAVHTGGKATYDPLKQEVMVNGKAFRY